MLPKQEVVTNFGTFNDILSQCCFLFALSHKYIFLKVLDEISFLKTFIVTCYHCTYFRLLLTYLITDCL